MVAGKLRSSSSAEQLTRGCCTSLPLLREMQGKRCDALDYAVGFGADAYFGREDLYGEVVRAHISTSLVHIRVFGGAR